MTPAFNVLFLCTHNSARSIMAEAILQKLGGERFHAYSAGSDPIAEPNAEVIEKLRALGHDIGDLHSKSWNEFTGPNAPRMDFVITLCDTLHGQDCPDFGDLAVTAAWPLPDPAKFTGSAVERAALLNELYASLRRRIEIFTALPFASLDRMALKARLDEIGGGGMPAAVGSALTMRVGINGMGRIGRLALRAAMGGMYRAGRRSARRQPARRRACQRTQGRRGDDRASARIRQHPRPLARELRRRGRSRHS